MNRVGLIPRVAAVSLLLFTAFAIMTPSTTPASAYPTALDNLSADTVRIGNCEHFTACIGAGNPGSYCAWSLEYNDQCYQLGSASCYWCTE